MIDKIKGMGIYELRNFARELGVHSPTTLKRDDLINNITGILNGSIVVEKTTSNRGRPPRTESMSTIFKSTVNEEAENEYNIDKFDFLFINQVNAQPPIYVDNIQQDNSTKFVKEGIVEVLADGNARLIQFSNFDLDSVLINSDLVNKYKLRSGMEISCICHKLKADVEQFVVNQIDESSLPKDEIDFVNLKTSEIDQTISINNSYKGYKKLNEIMPLCKGQKGFLVCDKEVAFNSLALKVSESFNNVKIVATLSSDMAGQDMNRFKHTFFYQSTEMLSKKARKFEIAIDIAKRSAENGEDVVVFIGNLNNLFKTYFQMFLAKGVTEAIAKEDSIQILKYFLNTSRNTEKGSLTLLILAKENDEVLKEFTDIINYSVKFSITNKNYDGIDFRKSFSVNSIVDYNKVNKLFEKFDVDPKSI